MAKRLLSFITFAALLGPYIALQAEPFGGGTIEKGSLAVDFSDRGVITRIAFKGRQLLQQHPGGVSTSGHKEERWAPWVPQSWGREVKLERKESPECTEVMATGILKPKGIEEGVSRFKVVTKVFDGRLVQSASITTPVKGLWQYFGSGYLLDPGLFTLSCLRADNGKWRLIPEKPGDRNLVYREPATRVEIINQYHKLLFTFDGVKTCFFDDRRQKSPNLKFEFSVPQQEITDARGDHTYAGNFSVTIELAANTTGETPIKVPRKSSAPSKGARIDLSEEQRLVEKTPFRKRFSLDGQWDQEVLGAANNFPQDLLSYPPAAGIWKTVQVPLGPYPQNGWQGKEHAAWYRVELMVPESLRGKELILHLEEISYWSVFYLNGTKVGEHLGGYVPVRINLTRQLVVGGTNTLEIFVGDETAVCDRSKYPQGAPESLGWRAAARNSIRGPVYSSHKGILQSVFLEARPRVHVEDVFVKTSVRKWQIEAETALTNQTEAVEQISVRSRVIDEEQVVLELPEQQLRVPPRATRSTTSSAAWRDPKLWDLKQPNLYFLQTDLLRDGKVVDTTRTRFGFREFRIDGVNFLLNGTRIKLRECATHIYYHPGRVTWDKRYAGKLREGARAEIESIQWANFNATRMVHRPHPSFFYDITDEAGHLAISHLPFGFHKTHFDFLDPQLASNTRRIIAGLIRKERNHPSIVIWEAENEGFPYGESELAYRFANFYDECVEQVCRELDPTRPVKFGGDGDNLGRAAIVDLHGGDRPSAADTPLPNSNWQVLQRAPSRPYGLIGGREWRWQRDKPLYFGEGLYWMWDEDKSTAARFLGEAVYEDPQLGDQWVRGQERFAEQGELAYWKVALPIWRMLGDPAGYCPWSVAPGFGITLTMRERPVIGAAREILKPERFFPKQLYRNVYAGAPVAIDFCFINDDRSAHTYRIRWKTVTGGRERAADSFNLTIPPAEISWRKITLGAPEADERYLLDLVMQMERDGKTVHEEKTTFRVYPRAKVIAPKGLTVGLYDPGGQVAALLGQMGVSSTRVQSLGQIAEGRFRAAVIGENALTAGTEIPLALDDFVRDGGRVLVLSQQASKSYAPLSRPDVDARRTRAFVFACDPHHPLLEGVSAPELLFWNHPRWDAAHSVAVNALQKFTRGNIHPVLECDSLWFSPLQEATYGKGLYIECSLDLVRKFSSEPMASRLWQNLLDRLDSFQAPSYRPLHVLRDAATVKTLQRQGLVCKLTDGLPTDGILMLTNASQLRAAEVSAVRDFAVNGGLAWIHARKGADAARIGQLLGAEIKVRPHPRDFRHRAVRRTPTGRDSKLLAGISSAVIYARDSVDEIWEVTGKSVAELASGGAAVECPAGKGKLIVERLSWDQPADPTHQRWADHFLHAFATNLGVEIDRYHYRKRQVFEPSDFVPIDLRPACNRSFRDDVAGDGKGGWTDQGDNDLRGMRTGPQSFHQIVFDIADPEKNGGKSCVVLHSEKRAANCPKATAELPVNTKARALFFLHTAAWYGRSHHSQPVVRYVVTYSDGTKATVEALGEKHIRDWWTPGNCEVSKGVSLLLRSKTEPDAIPRRRGLQLQEWTNPHPGKQIRSLRIRSGGTGAIPIVIGISALKPK